MQYCMFVHGYLETEKECPDLDTSKLRFVPQHMKQWEAAYEAGIHFPDCYRLFRAWKD